MYRICTNCIMDTSDSNITFDERGWCDYCNNFYRNILPNWHPDETGERMIAPLMERIRREGQGRDHDCLIGISGGVDSSYVTYLAKAKWGLRPLLYHVDAGWNSQPAVNNIEKLVDAFIDMAVTCARYEQYLTTVDVAGVERERLQGSEARIALEAKLSDMAAEGDNAP